MTTAPKTYRDTCPLCEGVFSFSLPKWGSDVTCPHCENRLLQSSCDPAGHHPSEIDPDCRDGGAGVLQFVLHPVGTCLCGTCKRIYPRTFSCCPGLVELAISTLGVPEDWHGPQTQARLLEFLRKHHEVAKNVVQRLALHARDNFVTLEQLQEVADTLGLAEYLSDGEELDHHE